MSVLHYFAQPLVETEAMALALAVAFIGGDVVADVVDVDVEKNEQRAHPPSHAEQHSTNTS